MQSEAYLTDFSVTAGLADAEFRCQQLMQQRLVAASQIRSAADGQPSLLLQQRELFPLVCPRPQVVTRNHQRQRTAAQQFVSTRELGEEVAPPARLRQARTTQWVVEQQH